MAFIPQDSETLLKKLEKEALKVLNNNPNAAIHPGIELRIWKPVAKSDMPNPSSIGRIPGERLALSKTWQPNLDPTYWIELVPVAKTGQWFLRKSWKFKKKDPDTGTRSWVEDSSESSYMHEDRACEKFLQAISNKIADEYRIHARDTEHYSPFYHVEVDPGLYSGDTAPKVKKPKMERKPIWG